MNTTSTIEPAAVMAHRARLRWFRWLVQVVVWLVLLSAVSVLLAGVLVPRLAGATPYTVSTGSMRPAYPPGTLIVVKPLPFEKIAVGDVVTYQIASGEVAVTTHRVVAVGTNFDGERYLRTQGDANSIADAEPVRPEQVRGTLWYSIPKLGYVSVFLTGEQRRFGVAAISTALIVYAASMFIGSARERAKKTKEQEGDV